LLWFLRGDTNIKYLVDNDCHIWDGDCYNFYLKQFEVDPNNFDAEELVKGHSDQCWGYPILDHVKPTSKEYKRGQINAYLEGKAERPFFYLTKEEFINKIKTDDEFAKKWGDLGPVYGKQWRAFGGYEKVPSGWNHHAVTHYKDVPKNDQIQNLINDLKTNPDSRRLMVNAWNVGELDQMVLPPCHYGFQVYTRELSYEERCDIFKPNTPNFRTERSSYIKDLNIKIMNDTETPTRAISLMWNQRSVDTFLGLPFNIASYGLLLEIIAKAVNMVPDQLIGNLGDTHLYLDHVEQSKEQIGREMTWEEQVQWVMKNTDVELENLYITEEVYKDTTPKRTRQAFLLPKLLINTEFWPTESSECGVGLIDATSVFNNFTNEHFCRCLLEEDLQLINYQSHPSIKAPLSN